MRVVFMSMSVPMQITATSLPQPPKTDTNQKHSD